MKVLHRLLFAAVILGVAVGCGGGGGGSSSSVGVLVTDSFRDDYDHVWATIYKVVLQRAAGPVVVFDDTAGKVIDLKTLRDTTGARFAFLSSKSVPQDTYTGVDVTVDPTMTLFPKGSATGSPFVLADSVPRDASSHAVISHAFSPAKTLGVRDDVVVDFDLGNFTISGGKIVPVIKEGDKTGISDKSRHEEEDYSGTVSGLSGTAPILTFTMTGGSGAVTTVSTDASTAIYNSNATANAVLANGKKVEVRGTFDVTTHILAATSIKIEAEGEVHHPEIKGVPSNINAGSGTFDVTASKVSGLTPTKLTVHVVLTDTTIFRGDSGITLTSVDFFTRLATARTVEVEGTYNADTTTLTATRCKLEENSHSGGSGGGDGGSGREAEVKGKAVTIDSAAFTFSVNPVTEFEGFTYGGGAINVAVAAGTKYQGTSGGNITKETFFAGLASAIRVELKGVYNGTVLTLTEGKLKN